ncbi:NADP-dependent L-serine/L-allo-threonine dehydrogenase ydfG [Emericellopsis atlantica]|uniref:NADP-dependent L-serine/L-allo-threonine dehydrogenase ydfG n=1 Tax=Emericellopsis atlantica TaxID=2614577 RepID=A0A9P7ZTP7_9HYPO|nr:NADP-dependent L-serine/L-allo-threonine dehydrogenase ydfG [Emericellopsis atlantica]KAG9258184.1 NADP-dependent L-serine/L-allo-threonine dehydrogenase ydfG [Emericellopsis atlantica]
MDKLENRNILITGASMGIGAAIARHLAAFSPNLILLSRSQTKLDALSSSLRCKTLTYAVDVQDYAAVSDAVASAVKELGTIDVLINNAGLALGAPSPFPNLTIEQVTQMNGTNVNGNVREAKRGTILNVTSTTALEVPPFPGESVYHANKALQEGFTNALRVELTGTDIRVLALRPGVVDTHFHRQRVGYDEQMHDEFVEGYEPLVPEDLGPAVEYMLKSPAGVSVKAVDVVPSAQRSLASFDRTWNDRNDKR